MKLFFLALCLSLFFFLICCCSYRMVWRWLVLCWMLLFLDFLDRDSIIINRYIFFFLYAFWKTDSSRYIAAVCFSNVRSIRKTDKLVCIVNEFDQVFTERRQPKLNCRFFINIFNFFFHYKNSIYYLRN